MTTTWTNREILKSYFRGIIDLQIEYMNNYPDMNNDYRRENEAFIKAVKTDLDEFSCKLSPELKDMYVAKYRDNKPFIEFYNVCSAYWLYMALNKELNALVSKIEGYMRDILIAETSNLDILTDYFTGRYTAYLDYIQYADEPVTDKKRFVLEVLDKLDPLVNKMESELLSIYVDKYRTHKPFTFYANNLAQQAVINSLNKKLNKLVQGIKRPQIAFKCQSTHQALQA